MSGCDIIHKWRPNGRSGIHVQACLKHPDCAQEVFYARCAECKQIGFRRAHFGVVYTWQRCSELPSQNPTEKA